MAFIHLSDTYIDHPKILALSDRAFRLWHEGMAFCRKHQTDGRIPTPGVVGFRYYQAKALTELTTPWEVEAQPLWDTEPNGYRVHGYLKWNLSKDEAEVNRQETKERVRLHRERKRNAVTANVTGVVTNDVTERVTRCVGNAVVLSTSTSTDLKKEKDTETDRLAISAPVVSQPAHGRSKWPIFKGQRLTVFDFQLEDLQQILGGRAEEFDFHEWFFTVDACAVASTAVIPKRDGGAWLQGQLLEEARRRGWTIAGDKTVEDPYANFTKAWSCGICGEVHHGTRAQAQQARCTRSES